MTAYEKIQKNLRAHPSTWLVTGCAGFIGSHLVEKLLGLGQKVVGLDNLTTGNKRNLNEVRKLVGPARWKSFRFVQGDIRKLETCRRAVKGAAYVLHQAALGSVPRSIEDPIRSNESNVTGFLNVLVAAQEAGVKSFVYASSSSVYGDEQTLPKSEGKIGRQLSPYAVTKFTNELYAEVFGRCYSLKTVGLRYFNVFGPRQDPNGAYAAVIPKWIAALREGKEVWIYGDGETSRDFCYIANVVQANILAAMDKTKSPLAQIFNIACDDRTTLNELFAVLREGLLPSHPHLLRVKPKYRDFRAGDVRHSRASIERAESILKYSPLYSFREGVAEMLSAECINGQTDH